MYSDTFLLFVFTCRYGCDMAFTPMIVSDSFVNSVVARDIELTVAEGELNN